MDTFEWQGVPIAYRDEGTGPAVLFLHNGGSSSTIWRHQVAAVALDHRAVAVDLPGFGCSPRPAEPLDLAGLVDLVAALADHLDLRGAVVVGNCMGSNIAARLAATRPDLVASLVLVNPLTEATFTGGWLGPLHRMAAIVPGPTRVARRLARRVVPPGPAAVATVRFQLGPEGVRRRLHHDPELVALNRRREQLPALVDVLDDMTSYGGLDELDVLDVPTSTVWGGANRVLSPAVGRRLGRRLGVGRAVVLDGCGHLPMLEDPDAVTAVVVDHLAAVDHLVSPGKDRP